MKLSHLTRVIRSKNASPFITTIDLFFEDDGAYERVKASGRLTPDVVAGLYRIPRRSVLGVWFVDLCRGIKVSFVKPVAADDLDGTDVYGAQQHVPLLDLDVP